MPNIYEISARFRELLLRREESAVEELRQAYALAWTAISNEIQRAIERDADEQFINRLNGIAETIEAQMAKLAATGARITKREQRKSVDAALLDAAKLIGARSPNVKLSSFSTADFEKFVGVTGDGTLLGQYFADLAKAWNSKATGAVRQAMLEGAALGYSTTRTAARARQLLDPNADNPQRDPEIIRSLKKTVRTESFRVYRETTRESYKDAGIDRWQWRSARTPRTCVICWAMDGKTFPVSEPFESHVNCRCTQLPVIRESNLTERETGADAFKKLEKGYQKQILGAERFNLYESGEVEKLEDFVARGEDKNWGGYRYRRSLAKLKGVDGISTTNQQAGAGGYWNRTDEKFDESVVKQVNDLSCVSAVGEMLARHYGLNLTQADFLAELDVLSNSQALTEFLNKADDSGEIWIGGFFGNEIEFISDYTAANQVWAVVLREGGAVGHAVLIDGLDDDGMIQIKDPFDQTSYKMTAEDLYDALSEFVLRVSK